MAEYPWYQVVKTGDDTLLQGDLINDCPILIPSENIELGEIDAEVESFNVVILSQSCDLKNGNVNLVLVSPIAPVSRVRASNQFKNSKECENFLNKVARGDQPNHHLLSKCSIDSVQQEAQLVDFRNVYSVHISVITQIAKGTARIRLLPPYREHLSQAFARFFMRVGLPSSAEID